MRSYRGNDVRISGIHAGDESRRLRATLASQRLIFDKSQNGISYVSILKCDQFTLLVCRSDFKVLLVYSRRYSFICHKRLHLSLMTLASAPRDIHVTTKEIKDPKGPRARVTRCNTIAMAAAFSTSTPSSTSVRL